MPTPTALLGRATRLLAVAAALTAWAYAVGLTVGARALAVPDASPRSAASRVAVTGAEDLVALQQAAAAAQAAADARNPRNLLFTADHALYAAVGSYGDCTGRAELTHGAAAIDTCVTQLRYFIGHNPGVFTGLIGLDVGAVIGYFDATGRLHRFAIVAERTWPRSGGVPPPAVAGEAAQFQTCVTPDGSVDRILDAVES